MYTVHDISTLRKTEVMILRNTLCRQCLRADNNRYFYQPWSACERASAKLLLSFEEADFTRK